MALEVAQIPLRRSLCFQKETFTKVDATMPKLAGVGKGNSGAPGAKAVQGEVVDPGNPAARWLRCRFGPLRAAAKAVSGDHPTGLSPPAQAPGQQRAEQGRHEKDAHVLLPGDLGVKLGGQGLENLDE